MDVMVVCVFSLVSQRKCGLESGCVSTDKLTTICSEERFAGARPVEGEGGKREREEEMGERTERKCRTDSG